MIPSTANNLLRCAHEDALIRGCANFLRSIYAAAEADAEAAAASALSRSKLHLTLFIRP